MLVRDNLYRYALSVFLPTAEANNIQSASSTIPGATITDVYNRSNTGASWAFPTTKGAVDSMPIIEFRSSPTYPIGTENVKAYDVNVQHAYVNNAVIIGKTKDGFTNDNELVSKSYVDQNISGFAPLPISMAGVIIPSQTSSFYYQTMATSSFNLSKMTTFNDGASVGDIYLAVHRGTLADYTNAVCIAKGTINTATNANIAIATLTIQSGQSSQITANEPLIVGMYMSSTAVDVLGINNGFSNNINSGFSSSNISTGQMPDAIPYLTGSGSGNYKFCCYLS
jgi:hypothetical protein